MERPTGTHSRADPSTITTQALAQVVVALYDDLAGSSRHGLIKRRAELRREVNLPCMTGGSHSRAARQRAQQLDALSHRRKLQRARTHIDSATVAVNEWCAGVVHWIDPPMVPGFHTRVLVRARRELNPDLPDLIGEALQALRQTLDHLVFQLGEKSGLTLTEDQERALAFPADGRASDRSASLKPLLPMHRSAVVAAALGSAKESLILLNDLARQERHRKSVIAAGASGLPRVYLGNGYVNDFVTFDEVILTGDERAGVLMQWRGSINMNIELKRGVFFAEGSARGREVQDVLNELVAAVEAVSTELEPLL